MTTSHKDSSVVVVKKKINDALILSLCEQNEESDIKKDYSAVHQMFIGGNRTQ